MAEQSGVTAYSESDHARFLVKDFIRRFYVNILRRGPEQGGMDFWSERLFSGQSSASNIALGFFFSNEFINQNHDDSTFIDIAYQTILSRAAEEGGKKFWIKQLANKDRLCERSEPQSYPVLDKPGIEVGTLYKQIYFCVPGL